MEAHKRCGAVYAGLMGATALFPRTAYAAEMPGSSMGTGSELLFAFLVGASAGTTALLIMQVIELSRDLKRTRSLRDRYEMPNAEQLNPSASGSFEAVAPQPLEGTGPVAYSAQPVEGTGPVTFAPETHYEEVPAAQPKTSFAEKWDTGVMQAIGLDVVPENIDSERLGASFAPASGEPMVIPTVAGYVDEADLESSTPSPTYVNIFNPYNAFAERAKVTAAIEALPSLEDEPEPVAEAPAVVEVEPVAEEKPQATAAPRPQSTGSYAPTRPTNPDPATKAAFDAYDEAYRNVSGQMNSEYERVALNYAEEKRSSKAATSRLRGVAAMLQSRLGWDRDMDGIPVISRADGTVGDVGTSWWNDTLGDRVVSHLDDTGSIPTVVDMGTQIMAERAAKIAARIAAIDASIDIDPIEVEPVDDEQVISTNAPALPEHVEAAAQVAEPVVEEPEQSAESAELVAEAAEQPSEPVAAEEEPLVQVSVTVVPLPAGASREEIWAIALEELAAKPEPARTTVLPKHMAYVRRPASATTSLRPERIKRSAARSHLRKPEMSDAQAYVAYLMEDEQIKAAAARRHARPLEGDVRDSLRVMPGGTSGWRASDVVEALEKQANDSWKMAQEA